VKCLLIRVGKVALRENVVACGWPQAGPAAAWWWPGVRNGARGAGWVSRMGAGCP
jgi:hypothetical protein